MDVSVDVNDKKEYKIRETVDAYFYEEKHGIIRFIPKSTKQNNYEIKDINVEGEPYEINDSDDINIKIGDKNKTLIGDKTYVISYTIEHFSDGMPHENSIYLDVLGYEWNTYIENFSSLITYPSDAKLERINVTNKQDGSEISNIVEYDVDENKIYLHSKGKIEPNNGITLNATLNEGTFKKLPTQNNATSTELLICTAITIFLILFFIYYTLFCIYCKKKNINIIEKNKAIADKQTYPKISFTNTSSGVDNGGGYSGSGCSGSGCSGGGCSGGSDGGGGGDSW